MCGIAGIISRLYISQSFLDKEIKKMNKKIVHRGPDDEGYFLDKHFAFGHRRLSIVDLSRDGHQPMHYKGYNGEYVITYNGEVYNYIELKEMLEKDGYKFRSNTDTEVIIASYDRWGVDCLNKFNGMWAFVIYNKKNKKFFISRDRFGIKPLYYYMDNSIFVFASEIKSILACSKVNTSPNKYYLDKYLEEGAKEYIKETAFDNIFRFMQASYFEGTIDDIFSNFKEQKFWELRVNNRSEKFNKKKAQEYAKTYYELLKDAVRIRLRADVKIGSALSGGLDSSSIVYLVNEILKEQGKENLQETFSSVYKSSNTIYCDESRFINKISGILGVKSNQIEPKIEDIPYEHGRMIYYLDNPPESTLMSGWHTFKKVSMTDVKVTLDGQGADEQLAGYLIYVTFYLSNLPLRELLKESYAFLKKMPQSRHSVKKGVVLNLISKIVSKELLKKLINRFSNRDLELDLNKILMKDTLSSLITLIHYSDRVSMAHSIESRMPFMDYRLVEFLASVPACYKIHDGWTKYLTRLAFDGKLPNEIVWRRDKMGWPIPEDYWFNGPLKEWFLNTINSSQFLKRNFEINMSTLERLMKMDITKAIRYLNIAVWHKTFFEK